MERVHFIQGDITKVHCDAMVNAANSTLLGGGGVDGAIHRAGGPSILKECRKIRDSLFPSGLPVGEAVSTTAGNLPASYVIHTVGPVWHGGKQNEDQLLYNAYSNSLSLAAELKIQKIAFPAISTGIYGFPMNRAASIVYQCLEEFILTHDIPEEILLIFFTEDEMSRFKTSFGPDHDLG